jgi:hypothetical protein
MNIELLTRLANKAMSEPPYDGSADRWGIFAELIVKECCRVVRDIPIDELEPHSVILAKHFGFEE